MNWAREEHNLNIYIERYKKSVEEDITLYCPWIERDDLDVEIPIMFNTYKEALKAIIDELILILGKDATKNSTISKS